MGRFHIHKVTEKELIKQQILGNPDRITTHEDLAFIIYGTRKPDKSMKEAIRVQINKIRNELEDRTQIENVWGVGYKTRRNSCTNN